MKNELGDRTTYIGGSDISALLNIKSAHVSRNRHQLMMEKLGNPKQQFSSAITDFGHTAEEQLISIYEFDNDVTVNSRDNYGDQFSFSLIDDRYRGLELRCHVDGLIGENIVYEAKTTKPELYDITDGVPECYYCQVQFNMFLSNRNEAIVHFGERIEVSKNRYKLGRDKTFVVQRNNDYIEYMLAEIEKFCIEVENFKNGDVITAPVLEELPTVKLTEIQLISDALIEADRIAEQVKLFKAKLLLEMEKYNVKSIQNELLTISYKAEYERKGSIDEAKLKKDLEELNIDLESYRKPNSKVKSSVSIKLK